MTLTDIQTHFDLSINFLDYYRVRLNLEKFIKHTNIENFQIKKPFLPYYLKFVCGNVKSNKFYRIINQNYDNNTLRSKWSIKLEIPEISISNWQCYNIICFKTIKDHNLFGFNTGC